MPRDYEVYLEDIRDAIGKVNPQTAIREITRVFPLPKGGLRLKMA